MKLRLLPVPALLVLAAGCSDGPVAAAGGGTTGGDLSRFADATRAQCVMQDRARLDVGKDIDAPGNRLEVASAAPGPAPAGACRDSTAFRYGSGLYDITGPVAYTGGMGWENPQQVFLGLHTRQYARAFAIESPCNGKRVMFVSADLALIFGSIREGVLALIAADPELSPHYDANNLMLSATHTHQGPAGYSHYEAPNVFHFGFDQTLLDTINAGVFQSIRQAHANLQAHPETGPIRMAVGELLDANINRSKVAFDLNPEAERNEFVNSRGEPVDNDKRFLQLTLRRTAGSAVGVINWFGVHATVLGADLSLVGSDNKGYASLGFERIMRTRYEPPAAGADNFVAAFAQTDEGDASPNLFILERPYPDPTRGGGADAYESNAISGSKQLAKALELYDQGAALAGPVDYRFMHVRMDAVTVNDPVVLASLRHPAPLDADPKRTCTAALGVSFGAGAEDGPGPTAEGADCSDSPDALANAVDDFAAAMAGRIPPNLFATAVLCQRDSIPEADLGCHAEKPIMFVLGPPQNSEPSVLPFQLFRVGNLAILGLPWEVTTMSARRIRKQVLDVLAPVGVDTVVIAGLANDFVHYLPTREEYSSQQYEGASGIFGPWASAAVTQESRRMALALRDGAALDPGPAYVGATPRLIRPAYNPSDLPEGAFGDLVTDVPASAAPGEAVTAEWVAGHPRNDLRVQASYVYAERQTAPDTWEVVASDRDPELWYVWKPAAPGPLPVDPAVIGPSTAEAVWHIPLNAVPGTYRLRHVGAGRTAALLPAQPYEGVSSAFTVAGAGDPCP